MKQVDIVARTLDHIKNHAWAQSPVIISERENDWYDNLFGTDALQYLLTEARLPQGCFRVVHNGEILPHKHYLRPLIAGEKVLAKVMDGTKVAEALGMGSSVVFSALEEFYPPIKELCSSLSRKLGTKTGAFAVVTPPGAKGFVPHVDRTDQLVIQCVGNKAWSVYSAVTREGRGAEINPNLLGEPVLNQVLSEGDMLYLPQGAPHSAYCEDSFSAHITLTFEPVVYGDWLLAAVRQVLEQFDERSLPPFYFCDHEKHLDQLDKTCMTLLSQVRQKASEIAIESMENSLRIARVDLPSRDTVELLSR